MPDQMSDGMPDEALERMPDGAPYNHKMAEQISG